MTNPADSILAARSIHDLSLSPCDEPFTPHCELDTPSKACTCVVCPDCNGSGTRNHGKGFRTLCATCDASGSITSAQLLLLEGRF